jgi:hypothetical protein
LAFHFGRAARLLHYDEPTFGTTITSQSRAKCGNQEHHSVMASAGASGGLPHPRSFGLW